MSTGVLWFGVGLVVFMPVIFHYLPKNEVLRQVQDDEIVVIEDEKLQK